MGWLQRYARFIWVLQRTLDVVIAVAVLWGLGFALGFNTPFITPYIALSVLTASIMWPIFGSIGIYVSYRSGHPAATYPRVWMAWGSVCALLLLFGYITQTSALFSRLVLCSWFAIVPFAICLHHLKLRLLLRQLRATGLNSRKAVIAGTGELSQMLSQQFRDSPQFGLQFCGFFTEDPLEAMTEIKIKPLIGTLEELPDYVRRYHIDVVYIAMALQESTKVSQLIHELKDTTACVYFVPNITAFNLMQAKVQDFLGVPLVALSEIPSITPHVVAKRITDIVVAAGTLVLTLPVTLGVAIALKTTSSGPILYMQRRYSLNGKPITVYKFRTTRGKPARPMAEPQFYWVGSFLKSTGLECLPQMISVLRGHMSLVGPRPQRLAYSELYRNYSNRYPLGQKVKPGLTGWAQIHGLYGEYETQENLQQRVAYDLDYLQNWSFWLDLKIMAKTTLTMLKHQNAYL
ncbi:exopolysaccharide biosynthesis polyprenyl glycosylphosphotransferase [Altericista sp. CCNU0014]|uniref:exopolysaccharide biosynthesis polyprenyl glycosylphosphotransferase n=1 Tax=Altericista sp. CCNU0014 TaxID=3082949 RepID=UPI003850AB32